MPLCWAFANRVTFILPKYFSIYFTSLHYFTLHIYTYTMVKPYFKGADKCIFTVLLQRHKLFYFVYRLLKFEFINHMRHYGYLQISQCRSKPSQWVNNEVKNIVIKLFSLLHSHLCILVWHPHSIYHMNHGYYGVFHKYTTLVLSHQKFATDKLLALRAWGLSVANSDSGRIFVEHTY